MIQLKYILSHFRNVNSNYIKLEDETLDNFSFLKDIFKKETNFAFLAPVKDSLIQDFSQKYT